MCYNCGGSGHFARGRLYPSKGKRKGEMNGKGKKSFQGARYKCGDMVHQAREYPQGKGDNKGERKGRGKGSGNKGEHKGKGEGVWQVDGDDKEYFDWQRPQKEPSAKDTNTMDQGRYQLAKRSRTLAQFVQEIFSASRVGSNSKSNPRSNCKCVQEISRSNSEDRPESSARNNLRHSIAGETDD